MKKIIFTILIFTKYTIIIQSQDMLSAHRKWANRYHFSTGVRAGEPTGINIHFHRGTACTFIKSKRVYAKKSALDFNIGQEAVFMLPPVLFHNGEVLKGGMRFSGSYFWYVPWPLQFYTGIGIQGGTRYYTDINKNKLIDFGFGGIVTAGTEFRLFHTKFGKHTVIFYTLFTEGIYYQEFTEQFYYLMPSGGIRLNFY